MGCPLCSANGVAGRVASHEVVLYGGRLDGLQVAVECPAPGVLSNRRRARQMISPKITRRARCQPTPRRLPPMTDPEFILDGRRRHARRRAVRTLAAFVVLAVAAGGAWLYLALVVLRSVQP